MALEEYHYLKFDEKTLGNPYPFFQLLRKEAPIYREPDYGVYMISRYDDILEVNRQPEVFSNILVANAPYAELPAALDELPAWRANQPFGDKLLTNDPPDHGRYKQLVNRFFTGRRVTVLEPRVREVTNEIIDEFIDRGEVEFVSGFAHLLPRMIVGELLGVPKEDAARLKELFHHGLERMAQRASSADDGAAGESVAQDVGGEQGFIPLLLQEYFIDALAERRRNPRGDIMSELATARFADGQEVRFESLVSLIGLLYAAGGDANTPELMTNGMLVLLERSDIMEALRSDPSLCENFVEEVLRFDDPTLGVFRVALKDTSVGGVPIAKSSILMVMYGSANHDEAYFDEPEAFDLDRSWRHPHIAFGHGAHFCPGATLARQEGKVAFQELLRRLDNLRLAEGKNTLAYMPTAVQRIPAALHLEFDKAR